MFDDEGDAGADALLRRARANRLASYALDVELLQLAQAWADAIPV